MEDLPRLAGSYCTLPLTLVNAPRTVEIPRWRTENCAAECLGSICHASCAAADSVRSNATTITSADTVRNFNQGSPGMDSWEATHSLTNRRKHTSQCDLPCEGSGDVAVFKSTWSCSAGEAPGG